MNRVNERLWVAEIVFSKTPKTAQDRHVKLILTSRCIGVGLEKAYSLVAGCIPVALPNPLEDVSVAYRNGGRGHTQVVSSFGRS